jgi:hypothetical protein
MSKPPPTVVEKVKVLWADPRDRIRLDDYVAELLKHTIEKLSSDSPWARSPVAPDTVEARIHFLRNKFGYSLRS